MMRDEGGGGGGGVLFSAGRIKRPPSFVRESNEKKSFFVSA